MKSFLFIIFFLSFSAIAGTDIQNGGGGISVNGTVATFYSATLQIYPESNLPSLKLSTLEGLIKARQISSKAKIELLENISDFYGRKYFAVDESALNEEVMDNIKSEYHRVTNVPLENLTIFAVTDPKSKITLILPDFYRLNSAEKLSILLHESLWINGRVKSYEKMLEIDKASQIYFEYPRSCTAIYDFTSQLESIFDGTNWALNDGFGCEINKYKDLLGIGSAPIEDLIDAPARGEFAKLLISSHFSYPYKTTILIENLENDSSRVFTVSRRALASKLRNDYQLQVTLDKNALELMDKGNILSSENIEIIAKLLEKNKFYIPFATNSFSMHLIGVGTVNLISR